MAQPPLVSVILPVFNAELFLKRALDSALAQDGVEVEVLAVDDASADGSHALLEALSRDEPRLKVARNAENSGPSVTRNRALEMATGEWIAVLDADDAYAAGRLRRLVDAAQNADLEVISDFPVLYDLAADQPAATQYELDGTLQVLDVEMLLSGGRGLDYGLLKPMFRATLAREGAWRYREDLRHGEDFALYFKLLLEGRRFGALLEALYLYSTRFGERSGAFSTASVTDVNYRAVAGATPSLKRMVDETEISPERRMVVEAQLDARAGKALAQNAVYGWMCLYYRDWARLRRWLAADRRNAAALMRYGAGRIGRRLGIGGGPAQ